MSAAERALKEYAESLTRRPVTAVEIVRPRKSKNEKAAERIALLLGLALATWILMLILGTITPWHLGYWHSLLAIIGARTLQRPDSYLQWSRLPFKKEA